MAKKVDQLVEIWFNGERILGVINADLDKFTGGLLKVQRPAFLNLVPTEEDPAKSTLNLIALTTNPAADVYINAEIVIPKPSTGEIEKFYLKDFWGIGKEEAKVSIPAPVINAEVN